MKWVVEVKWVVGMKLVVEGKWVAGMKLIISELVVIGLELDVGDDDADVVVYEEFIWIFNSILVGNTKEKKKNLIL